MGSPRRASAPVEALRFPLDGSGRGLRRASASVASPPTTSAPPLRLRYVLLALLLLLIVPTSWARGRAAWQLHGRASAWADYALCMVGPIGPSSLRENRAEYDELLRRRLVQSSPDARPFEACVRFVERMQLGPALIDAHRWQAASFVEYWDEEAGEGHRLSELGVSTAPLAELTERAWPFVRGGYAKLMEPSQHSVEAPHSPAPVQPGIGSGLPARRAPLRQAAVFGDRVIAALGDGTRELDLVSDDGGVSFRSARHELHSELSERCAIDREGRAFSLVERDDERFVLSQGGAAAPHLAFLASTRRRPLSIACDRAGLVVLLGPETEGGAVSARSCTHRGRCTDFALPRLGAREPITGLDLARIEGDTIVAWVTGGIARVSSSRDQGRTWTPWMVAFDRRSLREDVGLRSPPSQLLVAGDRLLFYGGGARSHDAYHLLVSDDHGASFHAPD